MPTPLRWGVLSTAAIGLRHVIPAMQQSPLTTIAAIASRDLAKARQAAQAHGIPTTYGSYEELLADPTIDAIYNPLPNHLHVPWTIKAAEAGKHVLCEKPLSMTAAEAETLLVVRARTGVKIGEAFMIESHPQWIRLRELLREGRIGQLRSIAGVYSYHNTNPADYRNHLEFGGGGLLDIGCYLIHGSRFAFEAEPTRVVASIERDPESQVDRLTSAILEFPAGRTIFTCSTQMLPTQRLLMVGTKGRIDFEIPFNPLPNRPARLLIDSTGDLRGTGVTAEVFPTCDQYTLQGDAFTRAILEDTEVPVPLEDSINNMKVIEAVFRSGSTGQWVSL
ncbi:MAG: Gfo/Idh/MocA family oxidoreductase [Terracidiphilus sp.]